MIGPAFFVTHAQVSDNSDHSFQRIDKLGYGDLMHLIFAWCETDHDKDMDLIGGLVPWGLREGIIGFTIASSVVSTKLRPLIHMSYQDYSKYFNGSLPHHCEGWHVCDNCGAYCQGDTWPGGCNMCLDAEYEINECDCEESGGEERARTCPMHGEYGVLRTEFPSEWADSALPEPNESWFKPMEESAVKQWSKGIEKELLGDNSWKSPYSYQKKASHSWTKQEGTRQDLTPASLISSQKDTSGKRMSFLQSNLMGIGALFILCGYVLSVVLLHPFPMLMTSLLGATLMTWIHGR